MEGDSSIAELCEVIDMEVKSPVVADLTKDDTDDDEVEDIDTKGTESSGDKKDAQPTKCEAVKRLAESSADKPPAKVARNKEVTVMSLIERMQSLHTDYGKWLCILNLPDWSDKETEQVLRTECTTIGSIHILKDDDLPVRVVLLQFQTAKLCDEAYSILKDKTFENNNPAVFRRNEGMFTRMFKQYVEDFKAERGETEKVDPKAKRCPTEKVNCFRYIGDDTERKLDHDILDIWKEDKSGLYGLNQKVLKEKGIKVPLTHWVLVRNFKGTRCELKEIMDIAGNVATCRLIQNAAGNARVKYSHPIEAAQAVSLFNGQFYKGQALEVTIDDAPKSYLPTGLSKLGPGFGADGSPLKDLTRFYERRLKGKDKNTLLDESWFREEVKEIGAELSVKDEKPSDKKDHQQTPAAKAKAKLDPRIVELVDGLMSKGVKVYSILSALRAIKIPGTAAALTKTGARDVPKVGQLRPKAFATEKRANLPTNLVRKTILPQGRSSLPQRSNTNPEPWTRGPILQDSPINNQFRNRGNNGSFNGAGFGSGSQDLGSAGLVPVWADNRGNNMGMNAPMGSNMGMSAPMGPNMGMNVPMGGQNIGRNAAMGGPNINVPMGGAVQNKSSVTVELNNLPTSMNYNFLCDKMGQCGNVQCVLMKQPGSAIVRFMNDWEAERCIDIFNNTVVEGHRIDVRYCFG